MAIQLLFDHNVDRAIVQGLRLRSVDVLTVYEDGSHLLDDPELLDRAAAVGRVLFSHDADLIIEARRRQSRSIGFAGVIFASQMGVGIGACIEELEFIAKAADLSDLVDTLLFLPLR